MTPRLTYKNIAYLGLTQIGVVVAGVLAAGATFKMWDQFGVQLPQATKFAVEWGFLNLAIPLIWITVAMVVQGSDQTGDAPEVVTFLSGLLVLFVLLSAALNAAVLPWIRIFMNSTWGIAL